MRHKYLPSVLTFLFALIFGFTASAGGFIDYGPAKKFIEVEFRGIVGSSTITENYLSSFPEISQMNTSGGTAVGAGVTAVFGMRDWIGLGTGIYVVRNRYRMDIAVTSDEVSSISNVFLRNTSNYIRIPVYMQFRFNIDRRVRWRVDAGIYYAYGFGGSQSQDIYTAQVNSLGQLVSTVMMDKYDYFNNSSTFINAFRRSDIGLHLATSFKFSRITIGGMLGIGFKNIAFIPGDRGIVVPNVHNFSYGLTVGYTL